MLITCPEKGCGKQFSDTADSCPNCGFVPTEERKKELQEAAKPPPAWLVALVALGMVLFVLVAFSTCSEDDGGSSVQKPPTRAEKIESQFSAWDGSHRALEALIKSSMNDPDSYEHMETKYSEQGNQLYVRTKFRGKNAFGGFVVDSVEAKFDLDGNLLEVIEL